MLPAVALADPGETLTAVEPGQVVHDLDPGAVLLGEDGAQLARGRVGEEELQGVLQPVEPLHHQFAGVGGPFHPGGVVFSRVAHQRASHTVVPPAALTTPMRAAELVSPALGYCTGVTKE